MKAVIFHKKNPTYYQDSSKEGIDATRKEFLELFTNNSFTWVGSVDVEEGKSAFENAYMESKNTNKLWFDKVSADDRNTTLRGARSTSVGDIIAIDGNFQIVGGIGFFKLF